MSDMFSKISELLNDPEASQKIRSIAESLSAESAAESEESDAVPAESVTKALSALQAGSHSRELTLLNAIKPYLRASRAERIDSAIRAIRTIDLLSGLR